MQAVQAQVVEHYRSNLVNYIRANGGRINIAGRLTVKLANSRQTIVPLLLPKRQREY